jgi:HK97 family phage portal protein
VGLWSWLSGAGAIPNTTVGTPPSVGPAYSPGDPDGVDVVDIGTPNEGRMAAFVPSPWDGWPASWASPEWGQLGPKFDELVDVAWAALDLNASVLSSMPVYRTRNGQVLPATTWMANPDPMIYTAWPEFAKQLFWDWQGTGEAFVLPMSRTAEGWPYNFRVIPPWLINAEMGTGENAGRREYTLGALDVTADILHLRYKSTTASARGTGPLQSRSAGVRLIAAAVLARYASELASGGGIPKYVLEVETQLTEAQANALKEQWWASRMADLGEPWKPAVLSGGAKAKPLQLDPEKMMLNEVAAYNDARISNLLGVPAFLLGLPGGDSMTYSNATSLFDFHDRRYLHTAATHVMTALSGWALPRGQAVELNRDEYSRPPLLERATAYEKLAALGALNAEEIRIMERLVDAPGASDDEDVTVDEGTDDVAAQALTGGGRS